MNSRLWICSYISIINPNFLMVKETLLKVWSLVINMRKLGTFHTNEHMLCIPKLVRVKEP